MYGNCYLHAQPPHPHFYSGIPSLLPATLRLGYFVFYCFYLLSPTGKTLKHLSFPANAIACERGHADRQRLVLIYVNPLNAELNPLCHFLALLGAHHFLHVSRIRVKSLTLRLLTSYIYGAPILDVSRSLTTT